MSPRKNTPSKSPRVSSKKNVRTRSDVDRPIIKKDYPDRDRQNQSDIKVGEVFIATVKDLASDGRGVLEHSGGRTVFVAGVWLHEEVEVKITALKGRVAFGNLLNIISASDQREAPACKHQGIGQGHCGGCPWMFVSYKAQLEAKQQRVEKNFARLNLDIDVKSIIGSPKHIGYRNRAQLKTNGREIGFMSAQSNHLVKIEDCPVLTDKNRETLQSLLNDLPKDVWKPRKKNTFTTLDIDESIDAKNVSVNQRLPFKQGNSDQNDAMKFWLKEQLSKITAPLNVLELFCGSGNFTEVVASCNAASITAVEVSESSVNMLKQKELPGVNVLTKNLFDENELDQALFQAKEANVLILDPPRDGLKVTGQIFSKKSKLNHVFYVSCDLATLTRDVALFQKNKYKIVEVQPIDQFPNTPHIECLVALKKK